MLGIDIVANDLCWIGIEGNSVGGTVLLQTPPKLKFPNAAATEFGNLASLKELVIARLSNERFERVGIVKASAGATPLRAKCEFAIELACHETRTECRLVAAQTISAAEKRKIQHTTGSSLIVAFNGGKEIQPKYLERAATCAWCILS